MATATLCPKCNEPVGGHTVDQLQACLSPLYDFDLPFEAVPVTEQDVAMVLCGSLIVKAAVHTSPLGVSPLLLFDFSGPEGPLPTIGLLLDESHMRSLNACVAAAIKAAIGESRKAR